MLARRLSHLGEPSPTVIEDVYARKIFNSRGEPTIEVDVITAEGFGRASAPSGKSRGVHEAVPYPEGGVDAAVAKVEEVIAPEIIGLDAAQQSVIDDLLREVDGTENFSNIGGNTAYAVSLAVANAAASARALPLYQHLGGVACSELPYPLGNVLGGGKHAGGGAPDIQEFLVIPVGASSVSEALEAVFAVHRAVRGIIESKDPSFTGGRGDEGAWAPNLSNEEALDVVYKACDQVSKEMGFEVRMGLDVAASSLWNLKKQRYVYARDGVERSAEEQLSYMLSLVEEYELAYLEDPCEEEDFESFAELTRSVESCLVCGDDLFTTNVNRLRMGVEKGACNAIIIKINQVGTLSQAIEAVRMAKKHGLAPVVSHRSGETPDPSIAHVCVGLGCPIIKTGVVGGERVAKLNELLRIEDVLGDYARMAHLNL